MLLDNLIILDSCTVHTVDLELPHLGVVDCSLQLLLCQEDRVRFVMLKFVCELVCLLLYLVVL